MCGLTGFYAPGTVRFKTELHVIGRKMTETLTHRGPDASGLWQEPDLPLVLGHRRLSILDLGRTGAQPMASNSGRYVLIYNGETYNHPEIRSLLEKAGVVFRGRSDTETVLSAIERWGLNQTLQKMAGMFAFVLWDRKERQLHFVRDRLGKKPLYVGWAGGALVFGSELKALRAYPDFEPEIDRDALALYLDRLYVPAPHCIYRHIRQLPPGHRLTLDLSALQAGEDPAPLMRPYWDAAEQLEVARSYSENKSEAEVVEDFEKHLSLCVRERMISDVPLGAFLSGGIDSSAIVALMQASSDRPVKTYTIGFHEAGFDEARQAAKIAAHLGTEHHEHYCTVADALDVIPALPDIYDEPFADQSAIPTYLVSRFARQGVTVALSGDGGDELLGGYMRHISGPHIQSRMRFLPWPLRILLSRAITALPPERWQALCQSRPHFGYHMHKAASVLKLRTPEEIYMRLTGHAREQAIPQALPRIAGLTFAEQMMFWDLLTYLPGDILTKVDRASMACGLEVRAPLLDHRLFEYVWSLPPTMKIRGGRGKYLLRRVLERHMPATLFERPKQGFNMPVGAWLREGLRDWAEDLLDEKTLETQNFLDVQAVRRQWNAHLQGRGDHAHSLWAVLMFQAWHRRWMPS